MISDEELIERARTKANKRELDHDVKVGSYGAALIAANGKVYDGVTLELPCNLGCCAEYNASIQMIADGETKIQTIVAVKHSGEIYSPCGRCREFLVQINHANKDTRVIIGEGKVKKLSELLPDMWR